MLPKNPFNSTYSEMIDSSQVFLSLFDESYLQNRIDGRSDSTTSSKSTLNEAFITEDMFSKIVFFSSALGGGKSSMLHFFSPAILDTIAQSKDEFPESYGFLERLGIIAEGKVKLLGVNISCARNYEIIDDIYENGRRKVAFFALLNVRILKETLKSILTLKRATPESLHLITFVDIPSELSGVFLREWNGEDYYRWACEEERLICEALNDMDDLKSVRFIHNYLSIIQLFEAGNIKYDGNCFVDKVLFMLDDVHRLTQHQKQLLRESLFIVRANVGVWLTQRTYGLEDDEVLGLDGSYGREYITRRFEDYYSRNSKGNDRILQKIADRRAKAAKSIEVSSFQSCIADKIDLNTDSISREKVEKAYVNLKMQLSDTLSDSELEHLVETDQNYLQAAITLRAVKIFIDRKMNTRQLSFDALFFAPTQDEIAKSKSDSTLRSISLYYLSIEYGLPFYYGLDKLCALSSFNVYQFLSFSGAIFERRLSYRYRPKGSRNIAVPPLEQDQIIRNVAKNKWDELRVSYINSDDVKNLLKNIAALGEKTRDAGTASYSGGAYTGIGIKKRLFHEMMAKEEYQDLRSLLAQCVSNNLLRMQEIKQGNKDELYLVFYLNRWICVYFNLPLSYGGWKPCSESFFTQICREPLNKLSHTISILLGGELS